MSRSVYSLFKRVSKFTKIPNLAALGLRMCDAARLKILVVRGTWVRGTCQRTARLNERTLFTPLYVGRLRSNMVCFHSTRYSSNTVSYTCSSGSTVLGLKPDEFLDVQLLSCRSDKSGCRPSLSLARDPLIEIRSAGRACAFVSSLTQRPRRASEPRDLRPSGVLSQAGR